ncbi:hypothetical protein [Aliihoeflea sp. PC F10.4]
MNLTSIQTWELLSYVVTVIGLPVAIVIFTMEQRKERQNEEAEIQQTLADGYTDFLKLALEHPDLRLLSANRTPDLSPEQAERVRAIYSVLVSFFERTYVLTYRSRMNARQKRYWKSWEDLMREWCARDDFRDLLPNLLIGEDPQFADHLTAIAAKLERG